MIKILKSTIVSLFILIFITACYEQTSNKKTLEISKEVVSLVEQNQIESAFDLLKLHWPLSDSEVDNLMAHTKKQREIVKNRYGLPIGIEFIRTEKIGKSMIRHTFIEKFENHALQWQLSFYKPKDQWVVNSVYWDDKISELYRPRG